MIILKIILLIALFLILGKSADLLIKKIKKIADALKLNTFVVGTFLGILTTIPEFILGLNAIKNGTESISLGNLLGGIVVIFTLVLGISLVLNRRVETDSDVKKMLLNFGYILLPALLCLKGNFGYIDGIMLITGYLCLTAYSNSFREITEDELKILEEKRSLKEKIALFKQRKKTVKAKDIIILILSIAALILLSNIIMRLTGNILMEIQVPEFIIGVIVFSIGTNLPELIVTIKAALNKRADLSISHLMGSAMANVLILSILSLIKGFTITVNGSYIALLVMMVLISILVTVFHKTDKSFSRKEGIVLLLMYLAFVCSQMYFTTVQ